MKKAVIVIKLIEESKEKPNQEIEKEILEQLSENHVIIPWAENIEKITVLNDNK
ncbi:MAG: hypothetical protein QW270_06910 [Candidatus Bathyarchaeia archaeon]